MERGRFGLELRVRNRVGFRQGWLLANGVAEFVKEWPTIPIWVAIVQLSHSFGYRRKGEK